MTENEAIIKHIEENNKRIENIKFFMSSNTDANIDDCKRNIEILAISNKALEKQIPKKPKHTLIKHGKHAWRKKENGEVDDFAWDFEYHNGVACEVCGETVCVHCNPEYDELTDCEEEYWNCPSCGKEIYYKSKCCDCGQKLNWESDTD